MHSAASAIVIISVLTPVLIICINVAKDIEWAGMNDKLPDEKT